MKTTLRTLAFLLTLVLAYSALAQDATPTPPTKLPTKNNIRSPHSGGKYVHSLGCVQQGASCLLITAENGILYEATFKKKKHKTPPNGSWIEFQGDSYPLMSPTCGQGAVLEISKWRLMKATCPQ